MVTLVDERAPVTRRNAFAAAVENTVAAVWLAGVALSPAWFGSNLLLVWGAHAVLFGVALAIYAAVGIAASRPLPVPLAWLKLPLTAFVIVVGWAAIQTMPGMPASLQNPVWADVSKALGEPVAGAISVYPAGGRIAILWAATAAAVFFLAVQLGRDPARARIALYVIALIGGVIAVYGLVVYFDGNEWVLWLPKRAYRNALTATFINKNNTAPSPAWC